MKIAIQKHTLFILLAFVASCNSQSIIDDLNENIKTPELNPINASAAPSSITRTIKQDSNGNIWIATFEGVFRFDGDSFLNMTNNVSSGRFFSILEDRKGNFWFGSIGLGAYYYDGISFRNFTTKDGLINDSIQHIYEDKIGNIWFATQGGASYYDGEKFHNFTTKQGLLNNDLNSIIEDKTGKFWFASRGELSTYDGNTLTNFTQENGQPFMNVRSIIEDTNGHIWLGGNDGLWRYDGDSLTNISTQFIGYIYQDKQANIWTSSDRLDIGGWAVTRYNKNNLYSENVSATHIWTESGMTFGILEDNASNIWFGTLNGVCIFDGNTVNCLNE